MDVFGAFACLLVLTMFASTCWALVLVDGLNMKSSKIVFMGFLIIGCMLIGHYLGLLIALSNGLSFKPHPILWVDEPIRALSVMFSTLLAGGGFSFGIYSLLASMNVFTARAIDPTS
ncbi:hypothetical protein CL689_02690 [Candidatus Saccharibacteria bacterium]|nr:hypothetical protein [Candidatus Saccharibacteria bacterium]